MHCKIFQNNAVKTLLPYTNAAATTPRLHRKEIGTTKTTLCTTAWVPFTRTDRRQWELLPLCGSNPSENPDDFNYVCRPLPSWSFGCASKLGLPLLGSKRCLMLAAGQTGEEPAYMTYGKCICTSPYSPPPSSPSSTAILLPLSPSYGGLLDSMCDNSAEELSRPPAFIHSQQLFFFNHFNHTEHKCIPNKVK